MQPAVGRQSSITNQKSTLDNQESPIPLSRSSVVPQERLPRPPLPACPGSLRLRWVLGINNQKSQIKNAPIRSSFVFFPRNEYFLFKS